MNLDHRTTLSSAAPWARLVIVAYRNRHLLQGCLASLERQSFRDFEVVVVNNDCPERSTLDLALTDERFRVVEAGRNLGFAGGSNLGALGAQSEWIITLNPDTIPASDWLEELKTASVRSPEFDVLSSTLVRADNPDCVDGFGDVFSIYGMAWRGGYGSRIEALPDNDRAVFGACGAAACYRRTLFERFGGFDAAFFCYLEDVDLGFRLQAAGYSCLQVRSAIVAHVGGASSSDDFGFPIYQTHLNALRLILRNAPPLMLPFMLTAFAFAQSYILIRNYAHPETEHRIKGLRHAMRSWKSAVESRPSAREQAVLGSFEIARRLAWSPRAMSNHRILFLCTPVVVDRSS